MRRRAVLAGLAAVAVATSAAAACSGDGIDPPLPPTTSTRPTSTTALPSQLRGQDLAVVEQGVVSFADPYAPGQDLAAYGVIVQNPDPSLLAAGVTVTTRVLGADGSELLVDRALLNAVMPGRRMAVGRTIVEPIAAPSALAVTIEVDAWLRPSPAAGTLEATEAATVPEVHGGAVTRFAITSAAGSDEDGVDVAAVYRDASGRLLCVEATQVGQLPPGEVVVGQIRLLAPIPGLASTEVLVGRGVAAQVSG